MTRNGRSGKIRVLVVDDSTLVREVLERRLSTHPQIEVVATAADPFEARTTIESHAIDVVTLDLQMPRMDGLTFLKHLMRDHPLPVVVVSSLGGDKEAALACLAHGAVDLVAKPRGSNSVESVVQELAEKIITAAAAGTPKAVAMAPAPVVLPTVAAPRGTLVVVGTSTGGTQALEVLFRSFPAVFPPVVTVIHMPPGFTNSFARRLDSLVPLRVKEAEDGEPLSDGTIYIAPGNHHVIIRPGLDSCLRLSNGPRVFNQRPAVDVLFHSAAEVRGPLVTGALLTGMGKDGASGLNAIKNAGGQTVAQDEESCVVFGMPKEAILLGAANAVLPLSRIGEWVSTSISR